MEISIKQLKKLVMEAVEAELQEQDMNEWDGTYSRGGAGGNRHGDSWDEPSPSRGYNPETEDERQRRIARDSRSARQASEDYNNSSRYDESRKRNGLTLEALRRMVRAAVVAESRKRARR